jgi:hypothetical protein
MILKIKYMEIIIILFIYLLLIGVIDLVMEELLNGIVEIYSQ